MEPTRKDTKIETENVHIVVGSGAHAARSSSYMPLPFLNADRTFCWVNSLIHVLAQYQYLTMSSYSISYLITHLVPVHYHACCSTSTLLKPLNEYRKQNWIQAQKPVKLIYVRENETISY